MPKQRATPKGESSVDLGLIAVTLAMTPEERLKHNDRMIRTILELKRGFENSRL